MAMELLIVLVLSALVAFVFSNLGLGGGIMFVPILLTFTPHDEPQVMAVSLFFAMFTNIPAALNHHKAGKVNVRVGVLVGSCAVVGAVFGAMFTMSVPGEVVRLMLACVLMVMGTKILHDTHKGKQVVEDTASCSLSAGRVAVVGVVSVGTGFLSGSLGIGGGVITVLLLICALGLGTRSAMGTSAFAIPIMTAVGFLTYAYGGTVIRLDLLALAPLILISGYIGSKWGLDNLKTDTVRVVLVMAIYLAAAKMLHGVFM